ncbi:SET domain-containing protein [Hirsutella rhossiliensis]|uniref:SET domain-containing protein n=1 Tax=Hirsutella rhossiliensis TaxID=111463 RepID=A0A9P8N8B9_9HYPO|nr:SET domain-containing protein [Hirsutella rhossiliensis]KAH0967841.1 SET domain-containing protein [Hirsutella rhossiliensis]
MASPAFCSTTAAFVHWFQSLPGATFSNSIEIVDLRSRNAGRGIVAIRDIPADTTLFTIPRRAIVNIDTSTLRSQLPHLFESQGDGDDEQELDSWSALILVLMYEYFMGPSSAWKPYLDVLPDAFDTPMFWSDEELQELQTSPLRSRIGKTDAEEMFRSKLLPVIRSRPDVFRSSEDYGDELLVQLAHRMGSTIMAYAFDLEKEDLDLDLDDDGWAEDRDAKSMMGMVPMADMLNADAEFNAHVNHSDESLTVTSLRPIRAGEEILNYYGPHPNSELLRRYGYVTDNHSRYDVVEIPWDVVEGAAAAQLNISRDALEAARGRIGEDEWEDSFVLEREAGEPNSDGTLAGAASLNDMSAELQDQLRMFLKALQEIDDKLVQGKRSRQEALQLILLRSILTIESQYPTTIAEDELLLHRDGLGLRNRMAVRVRLGEKKLLEEAKGLLSISSADDEPDSQSMPFKRPRRSN